jgi:hypothetical protein
MVDLDPSHPFEHPFGHALRTSFADDATRAAFVTRRLLKSVGAAGGA